MERVNLEKKKGKKKKEKEVNQQEIDLNAQIGAELQIGETFDRRPRRGGRGQGGRGKGKGGRGRETKAFPSMTNSRVRVSTALP